MQYKIHGSFVKTIDFLLSQGEMVYTETCGAAWMRGNVVVQSGNKSTNPRLLSKKNVEESIPKITYTCNSPKCLMVFSPETPGNTMDIPLTEEQSVIFQKDAFLCAESTVYTQQVFQQKIGPGFGEGFILYQASGPGTVFLQSTGDIREYVLRQGEIIKVNPGHLLAFEPSVRFDLPDGELIVVVLSGPGRVWFQTVSIPSFAAALGQYKPGK